MKDATNRSQVRKGTVYRHARAEETFGTHLAHWPPPLLAQAAQPLIIKHRPGEPAKRATSRGWRLTRAIFAEFADEG
ncbi:hypothetical protein [Bradyrhizobium sp. NP1]|jgi:hypothetical protein|uniref:hypothetical protein n=1 Tax=Bradyrhizobium sp. NP1 TaxID=3049772 RepID=UPI0025A65C19|nr:hypothetical protein [Bradyrhizobium sp. NP1]WJR74851.1 hypothetical protein QOU61_18645 [Bradyrhizobium sp. NP1]